MGVLSPTFLVPLKLVVVFVPPPPQATASRVPAIPTANSLVSRNTSLLLGLAALAAPVYISGPALRHAPRAPRPALAGSLLAGILPFPNARDPSGTYSKLLHHRPYRPRQVDPGRQAPGAHGRGSSAGDGGPDAGHDGPGARAGHHDQAPGGPPFLRRPFG